MQQAGPTAPPLFCSRPSHGRGRGWAGGPRRRRVSRRPGCASSNSDQGQNSSFRPLYGLSQRYHPHCNANPIYIFLFWELRGLSPNFHTHVSVSYLQYSIYVFLGSVQIFPAAEYADRSWEYINRSQTHECGSWDCGRAIPFLGMFRIFGTCSPNLTRTFS